MATKAYVFEVRMLITILDNEDNEMIAHQKLDKDGGFINERTVKLVDTQVITGG